MDSLEELAREFGVATRYTNQAGEVIDVDPDVIVDVLRAMGADPTDSESIAASLADRRLRDWRRPLPPVFVTIEGQERSIWVHLPHGSEVTADVLLEDGTTRPLAQIDRWVEPRDIDGVTVGEATFAVPGDLPLGWHLVRAHMGGRIEEAPLVVTPSRVSPSALGRRDRMWGFMTQLYSMRSRRSWGVGDASDLADLATWSARELGSDFVLINPVHAASPGIPMAASPYLPSTRRFSNPLYLRIEDIPEYSYLSASQVKAVRRLAKQAREGDGDLLDRDATWRAKRSALDIVRTVPLTPARQAEYDAFIGGQGNGLIDACTWAAIAEVHGARWRTWPKGLQHPRSAKVARWRTKNADSIERHLWMQWLLDEQFHRAQSAATDAGMEIGIIHDLAVGASFDGADAWALQDVLARGVSVGAPPDMYNQRGQDWAQPPWRPDALADAAFAPYRDMLRTIFTNAGGVRIDHVLGLFRMWWIPDGRSPMEGTYVTYDHEAMIGILALEAQRADAVVIGEDLGTVEPWVADALAQRGILGTSVLWFERSPEGGVRRPEQWRRDALASVTVHDLPPTAGYLRGEHVRLRDELGLLTRSREDEHAAAEAELAEWLDLLREIGSLSSETPSDVVVALYRLIAATPACLVGVAMPDVWGERRAQNQPGTDQEYPNWRIPLGDAKGRPVMLDDLDRAPLLRRIVAALDSLVD